MPLTPSYPFRRLYCDYMVEGTTRVFWELEPTFQVPGTQSFQLEVGRTDSPNATDWLPVGSPAVNAAHAEDTEKRLFGKIQDLFYRVVLTTDDSKYVSHPVHIYGLLPESDWLMARELIRKERLRLGKVGTEGIILKRIRYGIKCPTCLNTLTDEIQNSRCRDCHGVGFLAGYHAPIPVQCIDLDTDTIEERRGGAQAPGQNRPAMVNARVIGFPQLLSEDVWVNARTDQRYFVHTVKQLTCLRGVPIVCSATLSLAPYTDTVYRIPVGPDSRDPRPSEMPSAGSGSVTVDHNYGGDDVLAYQIAGGCGILGATVLAFTAATYGSGLRTPNYAIAATRTIADGRWAFALKLNPGSYVLVFEKNGEYGPDVQAITVTGPPPSLESIRASQSSANSFSSDFGPV